MYLSRVLEAKIRQSLDCFPVTAIIGPRQSGKSTLAKHVLSGMKASVYLDLERPSDLQKLSEPELFLSSQRGETICIDEIQRIPEIFPLIRSLVDEWGGNSSFLILGSASRDLLRQSSESLAGRIAYHMLRPFLWDEVQDHVSLEDYISTGAFPNSLLASDADTSWMWRGNFISTFLERDLLQWSGSSPNSVRRLWQMLAHENGQTVNYSKFAGSLGISDTTVRNYIDLLASTFMVEIVPPYFSNLGKRIRKAPKVYVADSGISAALLGLQSYADILGHPGFGAMWEQIVLINILGNWPEAEIFHYRSSGGSEVDFVVRHRNKVFVVECKASLSPTLSKGFYSAIADINPQFSYVVAPVEEGWPLAKKVSVISLGQLANTDYLQSTK